MQVLLEECLYLVILDLEGPDGLTQLTFRSGEGGLAPLCTKALLLMVLPLLAELQLLSSGIFPVLRALASSSDGGRPLRE